MTVLLSIAKRDGLTPRQLLLRLASGRGHLLAVGTGGDIADVVQEWFQAGAADGFNVMCSVMPGDLQAFNDMVIPELVKRQLRQADLGSDTLRQRYRLTGI